jgi:hypothetical protein
VLDIMFVTKNEDGTFSGFDARDLTEKGVGDFESSRAPPPACWVARMRRRPRTRSSPAPKVMSKFSATTVGSDNGTGTANREP